MASKIKHSFKEGCLALINGGWANRVGRFCSYWVGKNGVDVLVPENPSPNSPVSVSLNVPNAAKILLNEMTGSLGIRVDIPHVLELRAVKKSNTATGAVSLDYSMVYLPTLTLQFVGQNKTVTGVTAINDASGNPSGWYRFGFNTGDVWLVEGGSNSNPNGQLSFANNDSGKVTGGVCLKVGTIGASDPWTVTQYPKAMGAAAVIQEEAVVSQTVNTPKIDTTHSTIPDNTASFPSSKRTKDTEDWDIGDLVGGSGADKDEAAGVKFTVITRIVDDGSGSLYCYSRTLTFSKAGILVAVSAENGGVALSEG